MGDTASPSNAQKLREAIARGKDAEGQNRIAEFWAKSNDCWIPLYKIQTLGLPFKAGSENETYLSTDSVYVYKVNNLMHRMGRMDLYFDAIELHNMLFPETAYDFVGFTGFENRSIYPIVRQRFIDNAVFAEEFEIDDFMEKLGFNKTDDSGKYTNGRFVLSDLKPRNVLKANNKLFVIDEEITSSVS